MNVCSPEEKLLQNESSQVESADITVDLIQTLNQCLFKLHLDESFPIRIEVKLLKDEDAKKVENLAVGSGVEFAFSNGIAELTTSRKNVSDRLLKNLCEEGWDVELDYSKFISHPGLLFVKRLTSSKVKSEVLHTYFNSQTKYKSLNETNLIKSKNNESYAILKFDNYLDCEYFLSNFHSDTNPFHEDPKVPMYLNKYISKKKRALKDPRHYINSAEQFSEGTIYNSMVLENLTEFFKDCNLTLKQFDEFLSVFQKFNAIELIFFPVKSTDGKDGITLEDFGYIYFRSTPDMNVNVLKCLYYLDNLTLDELFHFDHKKVITLEEEIASDNTKEYTLKLSLNQHRFNHYLHQFKPNQLVVSLKPRAFLGYLDYNSYNHMITLLSKSINYQETNIYVNNLSSLFKNDDKLWEEFWSQFGEIKSAKIIKPEFYSKKLNTYGRIGFIFYTNFKMALKAIILTNKKIVDFNDQTIAIKSSFAIQKSVPQRRGNHNSQTYYIPSQFYNGTAVGYPTNFPVGYYSLHNPYYYMVNPNVNNFQP